MHWIKTSKKNNLLKYQNLYNLINIFLKLHKLLSKYFLYLKKCNESKKKRKKE